uniref:Preprotein-translocase subunit g n=1 Tax=Thuretia quercifolia TaxID=189650 RepID=A0A1Z1ML18_9FLOR|nr:preprotein-translocase subunit g [Thuretia quercifolia]ARW66441.1 preprotein-translocase subunit g [Thuretia quercifolia]
MFKIIWYLLNFVIILLILFNNPSSNSMNNFMGQNKFLTLRSNQVNIQRFIFFMVILFIFFTALLST